MPYTLVKALAWLVVALLLGIVMGWLLRNATARRQIARSRSQRPDTAELERLRGRVANLESVVDERDRLAAELEACRSAARRTAGRGSVTDADTTDAETTDAVATDRVTTDPEAGVTGADVAGLMSTPGVVVADAAAVLGRAIELDDLKVVEGIGPAIEDLCHGIGIRSWHDLAATEVSLLRTMLVDAGPRFKMHDPGSWPRQAELLASGRWEEFRALTDQLQGGAEPTA